MLSACGGLSSEPQIVATLVSPTALPEEAGTPSTPPDMSMGAALFAEHCTACHGTSGAGDGALVQGGQIPQAANFQDAATAGDQTPSEWFSTITNGRIEQMMPPWREALTEEQRWAVGLYTYTLHYTQEQLARGRELWEANCGDCAADLTDQSKMVGLSDAALERAITSGTEPGIPALAAELNEEDRRAVVAYLRSLSLANSDVIGSEQIAQAQSTAAPAESSAATPQASAAPVTITGQVTNGTAGGSIPADLEVTLFVFSAEGDPQQYDTTADATGTYTFTDVPFAADSTYVTTAAYRERVFTSAFTQGSQLTGSPAALSFPIYELTEDAAVLEISGMATQVNVTDEGLEVAQVFNVANHSDRAFSSSQTTPDGRPISLVIPLPPGAVVPGFNEQGRYVFVQEEFTVLDTAPVLPGEEHIVQVIYFVDYGGDAIIDQELDYAINGPVRLLVRPENVRVSSDQLRPRGAETVGSAQYASYGADLTLPAGSVISYEISGQGSAISAVSGSETVVSSNNLLPVVLAIIGVEILFVALLIYWNRRRRARAAQMPSPFVSEQPQTSSPAPSTHALLTQIAELDRAYEAGEIEEEAYQRQRAALKARLAALIRQQEDP
jgi:mono/diheme cytochrome c family protein